MHLETFITSALMVLIATSVAVAVFKHFGLGSILGLLVAGIAVGPYSGGPYVTENVEDVRHFTELGVVLLLFLIGLEMKPTKLWAMRREVFGLGLLQILLSGSVIGAYFYLFEPSWAGALLIGMTFALSSTAMVLQMLQESGEITSRHGSASFAVLLMQDLAIVPLLAIVPILSTTSELSDEPLWQQIGIVVGMLALIGVFGRFVLPVALDQLSRRGNKEGFLLVVLLAVFLAAWTMHYAGISMALGAFIMGMLLSGSNYRIQVQALIEPYKGMLMSLFFVAVGMSIDLEALAQNPGLFVQHIIVIISLKFIVLIGLALAFGFAKDKAVRIALLLSQSGEFGFVLFGSAKALQVISDETFVLAVGVISVSMAVTPLMLKASDIAGRYIAKKQPDAKIETDIEIPSENSSGRVVIGGFGRVGFTVATLLKEKGVPFIAFDTNPNHIAKGQEFGMPAYYGDIGDAHLLEAVHLRDASLVVMTIDHTPSALRAIHHIRTDYPDVPIISRAKDLHACEELLEAGATHAFPEAMESSLHLGGETLKMINHGEHEVEQLLDSVREAGYKSLVTDKA